MPRPAPVNRRENILAAAREEFSARGFAGARMETIARRVGISRAALYLQFDSKEAVFHELVEGLIAETLPAFAPEDFGDIPADALLRGVVATAIQRLTSGDIGFVPRLIVGEGQRFPELARYYHDNALLRVLGLLERVIRHGVARGEFACADPHLACRSIAGGVIMSALWKTVFEPVGAECIDPAQMAAAHAETLLKGLLVREELVS
ncbi:MAG: TetR family transcriptional regulator [Novosphingobium sp.]